MLKKAIILGIILNFIFPFSLWAAKKAEKYSGISMNYTKINVGNLPIGKTISMKELANFPLVMGNNYAIPIAVSVYPQRPETPKPGYEAIPDANWIVLDSRAATIPAKGKIQMDVKVNLPDDESLLGRKFQANIIMSTTGDPSARGFKYGFKIDGHFLFSVAPGRNEQGLARALKNPADAAYALDPPRVDMFEIVPGKEIQVLTEENKEIVLTNNTSKKQRYLLSSVDPADTDVTPDQGSQFSGNPDEVKIKPDEIKLNPGKSKKIELEINVPKDVDFEKGPLFYLISVTSGVRQGITKYINVYLWAGERPAHWRKLTADEQR